MPADRAVSIRRHDKPAVAGDIDRPDDARNRTPPELCPACIEGRQRKLGAQDKAVAGRMKGEAVGCVAPVPKSWLLGGYRQ